MNENLTQRLKAVIFDLDGTLVDSITPFYQLVVEIFEGIGITPPSREIVNEKLGKGESLLESAVPKHWPNRKFLIEKGREIGYRLWQRLQENELRPIPGNLEALERLKRAVILTGVVTSGTADYVAVLQRRGFLPAMDAIVTQGDVSRGKPAPDPILECLRRLEMEPGRCAYVGDSPIDIQAGKASGVITIAVLSGTGSYGSLLAERPDHIIQDVTHLWEIPALFED